MRSSQITTAQGERFQDSGAVDGANGCWRNKYLIFDAFSRGDFNAPRVRLRQSSWRVEVVVDQLTTEKKTHTF
jgi:hypothetical protein